MNVHKDCAYPVVPTDPMRMRAGDLRTHARLYIEIVECSQLSPHLLARRDAGFDAASEISYWSKLLDRASDYFYERGAYSQAAPLFAMY